MSHEKKHLSESDRKAEEKRLLGIIEDYTSGGKGITKGQYDIAYSAYLDLTAPAHSLMVQPNIGEIWRS